jgi:hypothetical protein
MVEHHRKMMHHPVLFFYKMPITCNQIVKDRFDKLPPTVAGDTLPTALREQRPNSLLPIFARFPPVKVNKRPQASAVETGH